jgi:penicillin G amidase
MRFLRVFIIVLVVAAVLGVAAYFLYPRLMAFNTLSYNGAMSGPVDAAVHVTRDRFGIPKIQVESLSDLYFPLGYVHAQDRFPLMEYHRAIASGLADSLVSGEDGRMLARLMLLLGIYDESQKLYGSLKDPYRGYFDSYASGINAWKSSAGRFLSLKKPPDDRLWTGVDVIAIYLMREWINSFLNNRELLFPVPDKHYSAVLEDFVQKDYPTRFPDKYIPYVELLKKCAELIKSEIGDCEDGFAISMLSRGDSINRFAVQHERASSQFPGWYPVQVVFKSQTYTFVSTPGVPFFDSSISQNVSFATFPARLDAIDFHLVKLEKHDDQQVYQSRGEWKQLGRKEYRVDTVPFSFRVTDFGPVISDLSRFDENEFCIVIDKIRSDGSDVVARFEIPFANTAGNVIQLAAGSTGYPHTLLISSGRDIVKTLFGSIGERPVKGILFHEPLNQPIQKHLSGLSAAIKDGLVFSSAKVREEEFPSLKEYIIYRFDEKENICESIVQKEPSASSVMKVIGGAESPILLQMAKSFTRYLANIPVTSAKLSKSYLSEWKGDLAGREIAPGIVHQMIFSMMGETLGDELSDDIALVYADPGAVYEKLSVLLEKGNSHAFDNVTTPEEVENFDKVMNTSFIKAMRLMHRRYGPEMGGWRWDRVVQPKFDMQLARSERFFHKTQSGFDMTTHYAASVSYQYKTNTLIAKPVCSLSLVQWGQLYWGTDYPLSENRDSLFYENGLVPKKMMLIGESAPMSVLTIEPLSGGSVILGQ